MRVVIQRVKRAQVTVDNIVTGKIGLGLMVLSGFEDSDTDADLEWSAKKMISMRIFDDQDGVMNLSLKDIDGELLLVSQFTLHASVKKGNRPSYIKAAKPDIATPLYEKFIKLLSQELGKPIQCGIFGAEMDVELLNHGPVTITFDTKYKD